MTLMQLPPDVQLIILHALDARSLACVAATCSAFFHGNSPVTEALRHRAAARGHVCPTHLPRGATWATHLAWLEWRRAAAWMPVAAGVRCSFFLVGSGLLMGCGMGDAFSEAMLGHGSCGAHRHIEGEYTVATPTSMPRMGGVRIRHVSAGYRFSVAVSAAGAVYTWGVGLRGTLGHGNTKSSYISVRVHALAGHRMLSVAAGHGHCIAVAESGEVFSWGSDVCGQCGHGMPRYTQSLPRHVDALTGVKARGASAGRWHSIVVTEEGVVYSFGQSRAGQLGHGSADEEHSPRAVSELRHVRIAAAAAGDEHSLALATDGTVFAWGVNRNGQLGVGHSGGMQRLPRKIVALAGVRVRYVAAGGASSCAISATGMLFTWGDGQYGILGHGDEAARHAPTVVVGIGRVVAVAVSHSHTTAVTDDGGVYGWGDPDALGLRCNLATSAMPGDENEACILAPRRYMQLSCLSYAQHLSGN